MPYVLDQNGNPVYSEAAPDQIDPGASMYEPGDPTASQAGGGTPQAGAPGTPGNVGNPTGKTGYQPPPYTGDANAWIQQVIGDLGLQANQSDPTALKTIVQLAQQVNAPITMDQVDSNGHLGGLIINGQKMQLIDGNNHWTPAQPWPAEGSGGGAGGATNFTYPEFTPPAWNVPDYTAPAPFSYGDYQPLTSDTFQADPGYEFAQKEGLRSVTNNAAAQGMLRTDGTLKSLMDYGTGLANQEFANVDARNFRNYEANRSNAADIYDRGYKNNLTDWMTHYNEGADAFNRAQQVYGTNFGTAATSAGINANALNSNFSHQLSLFDIATRDLPTYTPTAPTTSSTGSTY